MRRSSSLWLSPAWWWPPPAAPKSIPQSSPRSKKGPRQERRRHRQDRTDHQGRGQVQGQRHHENAYVDFGDMVKKGEVLCELDQRRNPGSRRSGAGATEASDASLNGTRADLERDKVDAEGPDVPLLKRANERAQGMAKEGVVSASALDDAEKNYQIAANKQNASRPIAGFRPRSARRRARRRRNAPSSINSRSTSATPPLFRPSMASFFRATARSATPSVRFLCSAQPPLPS